MWKWSITKYYRFNTLHCGIEKRGKMYPTLHLVYHFLNLTKYQNSDILLFICNKPLFHEFLILHTSVVFPGTYMQLEAFANLRTGFNIEVVPSFIDRLGKRNRTSVLLLYRNTDHSEQYCAWTMDPLTVHSIINGYLFIAYTQYWTKFRVTVVYVVSTKTASWFLLAVTVTIFYKFM